MEKTIIPTWAEANRKPYHRRTKMEHFIYEHDPGKRSEEFRESLSLLVEEVKRNLLKI